MNCNGFRVCLFSRVLFICIFLIPSFLFSKNSLGGDFPTEYLVDSFDGKKDTNNVRGFFWKDLLPHRLGTLVRSHTKKEKTLNHVNNFIEVVAERVEAKSKGSLSDKVLQELSVGENFNGLDISKALFFSFLFKAKGLSKKDSFFVTICDEYGSRATVNLTQYWIESDSWKKISLSVHDFKGVNFDFLREVIWKVRLGEKLTEKKKVRFCLDEIVFSGRSPIKEMSLYSGSVMDNLVKPLSFVPKSVYQQRVQELLSLQDDKQFLREIAKDTWKFFESMVDRRTYLILDRVDVDSMDPKDYTSITNIAFQLMALLGASKLELISQEEALNSILKILYLLGSLRTWNGFWHNYYLTSNMPRVAREFISSVDNGWLTCALFMIRSFVADGPIHSSDKDLYTRIHDLCSRYLKEMNYTNFYAKNLGQINLGYDMKLRGYTKNHYGLLISEARLTSFLAIAKGDLPRDHWFRIYRTLPKSWSWQASVPQGTEKQREGVNYYQGYYVFDELKVVPSWGGSLFEFLMPTLFMDEVNLAKEGLGLNNKRAIEAQILYSQKKEYPLWGMSPCSSPNVTNGYSEYGVSMLASKQDKKGKGYSQEPVVTPHVSFLALGIKPDLAIANLRTMLKLYPHIYGEYGYFDSVDMLKKKVSTCYLALDKGMEFLSLVNYLSGGFFRQLLHKDPRIKKVEDLLDEKFFLE